MENNNRKKIEYNIQYNKAHYRQFKMNLLPEVYNDIKREAENAGKNVTQYLIDLHYQNTGRTPPTP